MLRIACLQLNRMNRVQNNTNQFTKKKQQKNKT